MGNTYAALRPESATRTMIGVGVGGTTGLVEGLIIRKLAPATGALEPMVTWGTLLGVPVIAAIAAMFTRGKLGEALDAMTASGSAIVGYTIPSLVQGLARGVSGNRALEGQGIKQLTQGRGAGLGAREMAQVKTGLEF